MTAAASVGASLGTPDDAEADAARRLGRVALSLFALSTTLVFASGLLGPSAVEAPLPGRFLSPPFWFRADPPQWLVTVLPDLAIIAAAAGLLLAGRALRRGWAPPLRRLIQASYGAAAAMVLVPPMGSADPLVYTAYGRLATTGGDPYTQTAATLVAHGDPVGIAVQPPWTNTPSVYGPVATAQEALASWISGDSVHTTVFILALIGAAAFVGSAAMLRRIGDPVRVTLYFALNPLLLFESVNAAHLDAFTVAFAIAAIYALHRRRDALGAALAGVLLGVGCATKLSLGLAVLACLWALRHRLREAATLALCAAAAGLAAYLPYGRTAVTPAQQAARMVSLGSAWRPLLAPLQHALGDGGARDLISTLGWATLLVLVWLLAPVLRPHKPDSGSIDSGSANPGAAGPAAEALRALALLGLAWILAAPYSLPWYDVIAWAPLAACAAGPLDRLLTARTAVVSAAYVPGLDVPLVPGVAGWAAWIRADAAPVFSIAAVLACVLLGVRRRTGLRRTG